jgi:hypothetical protein
MVASNHRIEVECGLSRPFHLDRLHFDDQAFLASRPWRVFTSMQHFDWRRANMHTPGFTVLGTALMAGSGVTWRRFACNAAWLYEVKYMNFVVMLESGTMGR